VQHKLWARLKDTAAKHNVMLNVEHAEGLTHTDTDDIQIAREGVPCVLMELPLKYMHTAVELLDTHVIAECGRLAAHFAQEIREGWDDDLWS
jgi:endoglucanase